MIQVEPKRVYDVTRKEWPGAASTAPALADTGRGADVANGTCSVEGCDRPHEARGWCNKHYKRCRAHGDPLWQSPTTADRFWAKVNKLGHDGFHSQTGKNLGPCWLWTAPKDVGGYGHLRVGKRMVRAHIFAYELLTGPIPDGLQLDHLCRVRHCVRPDHLEPVTQAENIRRGEAGHLERLRAHCPAGHPYDDENTRIYEGRRYCRACHRAHDAAYRARKQAACLLSAAVRDSTAEALRSIRAQLSSIQTASRFVITAEGATR